MCVCVCVCFTTVVPYKQRWADSNKKIKLENERLELRRLRADLLMCHKILHYFVYTP